ncbi:hypothetical protein C9J03_09675 [Photobacterium gaetbulicola]|uniref:Uncharacterized protein n=1 Tax=Photobacterium gaetbulicola Gung47 TaxID=658445 RepID=A0A0C5WDJ0_9GAMM|nr:hypothetical protein [Photobacterium gaetbulicola]AJR09781.1 hypothetical protein H744_2c3137 [Photobacterium gaetbulicola Gung47]PSU12299.1 hypothetical protein C9J03_09675 [Photobacterium gaetbulicola]
MVKRRKNSWKGIGEELAARFCNAMKSPSFIAYFSIGIVAIGGIGVWLPYLLDSTGAMFFESQNVFTFSVAILGTLSLEGFISKDKSLRLTSLGVILGFVAFLLGVIGYVNAQTGVSVLVNICAALTLLIFLFANANDEKFDDESEVEADATGYKQADADLIKDKS